MRRMRSLQKEAVAAEQCILYEAKYYYDFAAPLGHMTTGLETMSALSRPQS